MFAGGFVLGLFFGWLLHRERVERALYEDVVRARDRATSTLAETAARLELANRDAVRLRAQLTDAQHQVTERDTTIARLRREAETDAPPAAAGRTVEGGFEEVDVTEEVVPTGEFPIVDGAADEQHELVDEAEEDLELVDGPDDVGPVVTGVGGPVRVEEPEVAVGDEPEAVDDAELDVLDEVEMEVADEPDVDADPEPTPVKVPEPTEAELLDELAPDGDVEDDDELVAAGAWYDREPALDDEAGGVASSDDTTAEPAPSDTTAGTGVAADSGIGTPLVLEADAGATASPSPPATDTTDAAGQVTDTADAARDVPLAVDGPVDGPPAPDDLRRITGVGPALERALHSEGITTYRDLALLDEREISDLGDRRPRLANRLRRDDWVAQARRLHRDTHGTPI
jgi:predicted flap endonuclease-1-like 5' DNA nuclease